MNNKVVYNRPVDQRYHFLQEKKGHYDDIAVVGISPVMKASPKSVQMFTKIDK